VVAHFLQFSMAVWILS